jgi:hypothetical protein
MEKRYSSTLCLALVVDDGRRLKPRLGRFTPGNDPVPVVQEAGWAPWKVCTGSENLAPNGDPSPDGAARSKSLYRLSYPGPLEYCVRTHNNGDTRWRSWLRHCATSQKVAGSGRGFDSRWFHWNFSLT